MKKKNLFIIVKIAILCLFCFALSCNNYKGRDFDQIIKSDTLNIVTISSSQSAFSYRGQNIGYAYDMINHFCKIHSLVPNVIFAKDEPSIKRILEKGNADLALYPITDDYNPQKLFINCGYNYLSKLNIIQRKGSLINNISKLAGKKIFVVKQSYYSQQLKMLNDSLGGKIIIKEVKVDTAPEDLIRMVSLGDIDYTVADDSLTYVDSVYFKNITSSISFDSTKKYSWIVGKKSPTLADSLNKWFKKYGKNHSNSNIIFKRYFEESKGFVPFYDSRLYSNSLNNYKISIFDNLFKKYGKMFSINWKLLAAVSFHESRFSPNIYSEAGAGGLMGLMPKTASHFGLNPRETSDPEKNIEAAAKYLSILFQKYAYINNENDKTSFVLAAYNGGMGHLADGIALAKKYNENPYKWESVSRYLKLKSNPKYYTDPVCRNGSFNASETILYVNKVINLWNKYINTIKEI